MQGTRSDCSARRALTRRWWALAMLLSVGVARPALAAAQAQADTMGFYKALELEAAGKYREAAPLFRAALRTPAAVNAMLGLERVYAELAMSDSLLAPLDTLIAANPRDETFRTIQLRT